MYSVRLIIILSLFFMSIIFSSTGFIKRAIRLTKSNSIESTATLVAFRDFRIADRHSKTYYDFSENGKGRFPLMALNCNGKLLYVAAAISDYDLTSADIGREFIIRYRKYMGITLLIDDDISWNNYNQLQNILFWTLQSFSIIFIVLNIIIILAK